MLRHKLVTGLAVGLLAARAWAISPPQYSLQRELAASVGASPFVQVGEVYTSGGRELVDITVSIESVARGLAFILKREHNFGGIMVEIRVLDPRGAVVSVDDAALPGHTPVETAEAYFRDALLENPLVVGIGPRPMVFGDFVVEVRPEILQFWDDNLADPGGLSHMIAASVFHDVARSSLIAGTVSMVFSTAPVAAGHLEGYVLAAASTPGRHGSVWSTDLWVYSESATAINLEFLPADHDNSGPATGVAFPLLNGVLKLTDVVSTVFQARGVGSIRYIADGPVRVVSRTWTPGRNGGTSGEIALGVPAWTATRATCTQPTLRMLVDQRPGFRANLGLLNAFPAPARVEVRILGSDGLPAPGATSFEIELPVFGVRQIGDLLQRVESGVRQSLRVEVTLKGGQGAILGYLSEVDNTTNDSSYQEAFGCRSQ